MALVSARRPQQLQRQQTRRLPRGTLDKVSEADIAVALAALGKLYSAKVEKSDKIFPPVNQDALTATETAVLVSELLRAADLNVFDLAMWFRRAS